ncbi:PREDICTED: cilia- and flagella-associated protein 99-like [Priapulus caudatus]|uniref:Cilia- and flagella-associated protein 99-like n=1 Tax=Priapulus caudatus TaxID=37621 RepID=A0ABM1DS56_PRICU|nr:PREDICTED: cilia- and flagella-associated protein 99-like [Priapulus caudatus]
MAYKDHAAILRICTDLLSTYQSGSVISSEEHLKRLGVEFDDAVRVFIEEVFLGCIRFSTALTMAVECFRKTRGLTRLPEGMMNLYKVLCYLLLFRFEELGEKQFSRFVQSQDPGKMYKFLTFLVDKRSIDSVLKPNWCLHFDESYVVCNMVEPLLRSKTQLQKLNLELKNKAEGKSQPNPQSKATTRMKPFQLTEPKPKIISIPEQLPTLQRMKPVPEVVYKPPAEVEQIEKAKQKNKLKAQEIFIETQKNQLRCAKAEKSVKTQKKLKQIIMEKEAKLEFEKPKCTIITGKLNEKVPVRMNAAMVLREGAVFLKKEDEEIKKLEELEGGSRDTGSFLRWQAEMRERDVQQQLFEQERRHLQGKLSHEEAIVARRARAVSNKERAADMKREAELNIQQYWADRLQEMEVKRIQVEEVTFSQQHVKEAQEKLLLYKQNIVKQVTEEKQELMRQALEEADEAMRQKLQLIEQIRSMEATPVPPGKLVDLSDTAGTGLLCEMSIAELRERLARLRVTQLELQEARRGEIHGKKQEKEKVLQEMQDTIMRHRERNKVASPRHQDKQIFNIRCKQTSEEMEQLEERLQKKKAERRSLEAQLNVPQGRTDPMRFRVKKSDKEQVEEKRWKMVNEAHIRAFQMSTGHGDNSVSQHEKN